LPTASPTASMTSMGWNSLAKSEPSCGRWYR